MELEKPASQILSDLAEGMDRHTLDQLVPLGEQLLKADKIFLYGVGREGLVMKALAMRLYHLGLRASVIGDMNCPPIEAADILFVSAGPGSFETVNALAAIADRTGAKLVCATAEPSCGLMKKSHAALILKAQTMASDQGPVSSILPMGSVYELQLFIMFELLVLLLQDRLKVSSQDMRSRHTNLE